MTAGATKYVHDHVGGTEGLIRALSFYRYERNLLKLQCLCLPIYSVEVSESFVGARETSEGHFCESLKFEIFRNSFASQSMYLHSRRLKSSL